jgi:glycosyltransferase involved in cell wall biosynthesis
VSYHRVTVIVPVDDNFEGLHQSIDSVKAQTFKGFELIIVDHGFSTQVQNYSTSIAKSSKYSIRYLQSTDSSKIRALNLGVQESRSPWITFLTPGETWGKDHLQSQLDFVDENTRFSASRIPDEETKKLWARCEQGTGWIFEDTLWTLNADLSHFFLSKTVFEVIGRFDETLSVGFAYDFMIRLALQFEIGLCTFCPIARKTKGNINKEERKLALYWAIRSLVKMRRFRVLYPEENEQVSRTLESYTETFLKESGHYLSQVERDEIFAVQLLSKPFYRSKKESLQIDS